MKAPLAFENKDGIDLLETLLQHENTSGYFPNQLTEKERRNERNAFQNVSNNLKKYSYANRRKRTRAEENS